MGIEFKNKKAGFEYVFIDIYEAGIVLAGTEIKSIREGKLNLTDSYCVFNGNELWVKGMHISEYKYGSYYNHEPKKERKLLLSKRELKKLHIKVKESGLTIVPVKLYINDRGLAKLQIALSKGKKTYDKREDIKSKDIQRDTDRIIKG